MEKNLKKHFHSGPLIFLSLAMTVLFVVTNSFAGGFSEKYIEPYFTKEFEFYIRAAMILMGVLMILGVGMLIMNFLGRKLSPALSRKTTMAFQQVVIVEYPRPGSYTVGFITNETPKNIPAKAIKKDVKNVFIPTTASPLSGFVILVKEKDIVYSEMSVQEALKLIVSGGVVVNPK